MAGAFAVTAGNGDPEPAPQETKIGPDGLPLRPSPATPFDGAAYETAVANARSEGPKRALAVAEEYNAGRLDCRALPTVVADIASDLQFPTLEQSARDAGFVARVKVVSVRFTTDGLGLPGKDVTMALMGKPAFGSAPGATFTVGIAGGPQRAADGQDRYVVLPLGERETAGEQYLVFVRRDGDAWLLAHFNTMLRLNGDRVADTPAAREWKVVGARADDVLARAAKAK